MTRIVSHANAKVNLTLKITGKRSDGYHDLESLFLFLPDVYDVLIFDTAVNFSEKSAKIKGIPDDKNSIKKAASLLKTHFKSPIPHVEIVKNIPTEAGLGGGSSDAACFINSVFDFWDISTEKKFEFIQHAKVLGSDAIVFLYKYFLDKDALLLKGSGLGGTIEKITLPNLKDSHILIVNNGTKLSTKNVFETYQENDLENALTQAAIALEPSISNILADIKATNPILCNMSGSGTTCFGIYKSEQKALKAQTALRKKYEFVKISRGIC